MCMCVCVCVCVCACVCVWIILHDNTETDGRVSTYFRENLRRKRKTNDKLDSQRNKADKSEHTLVEYKLLNVA